MFSQLAERYNTPIHMVKVSAGDLPQSLPLTAHYSLPTYYRLLAPTLLPSDVERIIYFDCDMIIDSDIESLWNENIDTVAFGGVLDAVFQGMYHRDWNMPENTITINTGMLLINLQYWRSHSIAERCFDYIREHPTQIKFVDQSAINHVVMKEKEYVLLSIKYNFQTFFLHKEMLFNEHIADEIKQTACSCVVIHYTSKPWLKYSYVKDPYHHKYLYYRSISLWKNYPLVCNFTRGQRMSLFLYNIACAICFRKRTQIYNTSQ
jgi:lipopolysaccharide biosynthesis glycosyltransferase